MSRLQLGLVDFIKGLIAPINGLILLLVHFKPLMNKQLWNLSPIHLTLATGHQR